MVSVMAPGETVGQMSWLTAQLRYLGFAAAANLAWEIAHLPLYAIWTTDDPGEIAFAVIHCTGGDVLIAGITLWAALLLLGRPNWPSERFWAVAGLAIALGVAYTMFSEWLNTEICHSWTYSALMPILPWTSTGLSPLAQWFIIPLAAFFWLRWMLRGRYALGGQR